MRAYLLDNNHIQAFFNEEPEFLKRFLSIPASCGLFVCDKTLEEIDNGHRISPTTNQARRDEFVVWAKETFKHFQLNSTDTTVALHDEIIERILENHPMKLKSITDEQHLTNLGVDDYDVWAVAMAWEHNLTMLTQDKMALIREAVGGEVTFENWRS